MTLSKTSISFGYQDVNTVVTKSVTLTSSGIVPLIISSATVSGTGFTISGITFPITLKPGKSAVLHVTFQPLTAGTAAGIVALASSSGGGGTTLIQLSGIGQALSSTVMLYWDAPTSSTDPVAGFQVYRAPKGSTSYQLLNSVPVVTSTFTDTTVANGLSYDYQVESVDAGGNHSVASNTISVAVP